jgi:hypothetical protein
MGRRAVLLLLVVLAGAAEEPLTEEAVVRMVVAGRPTAEIVEAIRGRPVRFDLTEEMRAELRGAGVPEAILQAMAARQAELRPPEPVVPPPAEPAPAGVRVRLRAEGAPRGERVLLVAAALDPQLAAAWQLDPAARASPIEDVALYLACRSAMHVPDQWRDRSPLGRDFVAMPRHQMLAFHSGAARREGEPALLALAVPAALEAELEPDEAHDLSIGIAVRVAGRWHNLLDDEREAVRPVAKLVELEAIVRTDRRGVRNHCSWSDTTFETPGSSMVTP